MNLEKKMTVGKPKIVKFSIVALSLTVILFVSVLWYARKQRDYMVEEFNKKIDELVEINKEKSHLVDTCMNRLKACDERTKKDKYKSQTQHPTAPPPDGAAEPPDLMDSAGAP